MKSLCTLLVALLLGGMAHAQYQNTITKGVADLTSNVKSGLNVWTGLPGGGICQPRTDSMSYGGKLYFCIGTDGSIYEHNRETHVWTKRADMSVPGIAALAVKNVNAVYALFPPGNIGCPSPDLPVEFWNGTSWAMVNGCLSQITVGGDGFVAGITNAPTQSQWLWYSQDGGKTWSHWESGYTYVHMWSQHAGCAVSTSGAVYTVSLDGPPQNLGGNFVGCMYGDHPFVLMAWDASGNVSMLDEQNGAWDIVSGLSASHIAGTNKLMVVALDQNHVPHHWNIKARSITGTISGTWNSGCPGPGQICNNNPPAHHKGTVKVWFSSGHGINYSKPATVVTVNYNQSMSAQFVDVNPGCDPLFGVPTDVECQAESSGGEECLQSGAGIGNMPNPPEDTTELSHHYQNAVSYTNRLGPTLDFISPTGTQTWSGQELLNMQFACTGGTFPTCPGPNPYGLFVLAIGGYGGTSVAYELDTYQSQNPFLSEESWDRSGPGGTVQCLGDQITWGTEGNFDDPSFAPQCD